LDELSFGKKVGPFRRNGRFHSIAEGKSQHRPRPVLRKLHYWLVSFRPFALAHLPKKYYLLILLDSNTIESYNWRQEGKMSLIKTSITIPEEVYKGVKKVSKNFSAAATEALIDYLKKERVQKAIASFSSWEKRPKKSVEIVNEMRSEEGRNYADRTHRH
jgi:post-segregation antitoxin (ccd killing protein)